MSLDESSVPPDTAPLIDAARRIPGAAWKPRYENIGRMLDARAQAAPDEPFLIFVAEGRREQYSCQEFLNMALRVAAIMREGEMAIMPGDRVATLCVNDSRTAMVYFAAWMLGAAVVPVNCSEDDDRLSYILANCGAKGIFAATDQAARLRALSGGSRSGLPPLVEVDATGSGFDSVAMAAAPLALDTLPDVDASAECLIVYTSGTTGAPKGVSLDQSNLLADAESIAAWHRFGPGDRAMCVLPIHHVNGTVVTLVTPLFSGGSVVLCSRFHAQSFWQTLAAERCTWVSVVPTILAFLCEAAADLFSLNLSAFRHFICGAGPLTVELAHRFDRAFGLRVVHGYGLSETTCYSCFLPIDLDPAPYAHWMFECGYPSIGCPVEANQMSIHDADGNALPPEARGEIVVRGYNVMQGYYRRPEANAEAFAHSWFRTGDEGFFRTGDDGRDYYFITGRLKELFIRGGINYSPFDIDEPLNAIPGVKAAMAVGFENDFYGEEIGAYVQLEPGSELTAEEIITKCRKTLPYAKSPKVIVFGADFPVTSTGKYQRNRLKPLFAQWKSSQFREHKR